MTWSDETLMAFVDNELDDRERARQRSDESKERRWFTGVLYSSDGRGWLPLVGRGE